MPPIPRPALRPSTATPLPIRSRRHPFSTTPNPRASILFALHALSNSRETQHFNKLSNLSRTEHSPPLKLIKTSEIDPFPLPTKQPSVVVPLSVHPSASSTPSWFHDRKALLIGRAILSAQARSQRRLERALGKSQVRAEKLEKRLEVERGVWEKERRKQDRELKAAGTWIVVAVGVATALGAWRVWPEGAREGLRKVDSVGGGAVKSAMPAAATTAVAPMAVAPGVGEVGKGVAIPATPAPVSVAPVAIAAAEVGGKSGGSGVAVKETGQRSWWKGLFWVQS